MASEQDILSDVWFYREKPDLTPEEWATIRLYFERLVEGKVCPICGQPLTRERQIGRCVYGEPCGCRMFQGRARRAKR